MLDLFKKSQSRAVGWERGAPVDSLDVGFWQAFKDARQEYLTISGSESEKNNQYNYVQSVLDRVRTQTGREISNLIGYRNGWGTRNTLDEWRAEEYDSVRAQFPELALPSLDLQDITEGGERFGRSALGRAQELSDKRVTGMSQWGAFFGGMAGGAQDPVNVMANIVTAPVAVGEKVLKAMGVGGVIGGVSQAGITALNYDYRKRIDPDYTLTSAIEEVRNAVFMGAAMQGAVAGVSKTFGAAKRTNTRQSMDAQNIVERDAISSQSLKGSEASPKGKAQHKKTLDFVTDQFENRRRLELPPEFQPKMFERLGRVIDSDGNEVAVNYEVVEASDLITSHSDDLTVDPRFPTELQPRARERMASQDQINAMASDLRPEWLGPSPKSDSGAPIVGPDNLVESGNGRILAIRRAYGQGKGGAESYKAFLKQQGFDVDGMNQPVLVARRVSELDPGQRAQFVQASNRATLARLSAGEQALADARLIDSGMIEVLEEHGAFSAAFARKLFQHLPPEERANLMDAGGVLSRDGQRRIEGALLGRAYGDAQILGKALEDADSNIRTIAGALQDASGKWAAMRDAATSGAIPSQMDITEELLKAVKMVMRARDENVPVKDMLAQGDLLDNGSNLLAVMARALFSDEELTKGLSKAKLSQFLKDYADEALKNSNEARLFGEALGANDVLETALKKANRGDLLDVAQQALTPEKVEAIQKSPEVEDALVMEAQRRIAAELTGETSDKLKVFDDKGEEIEVAKLFDDLDEQIEAASKIEACATGQAQSTSDAGTTTQAATATAQDPLLALADAIKAPKEITVDADGNVTGARVKMPDGEVSLSLDDNDNVIASTQAEQGATA